MPNSLGPGELLHITALTSRKITICRVWRVVRNPLLCTDQPRSGFRCGRDSGTGIVCMGEWQGQQVLGMRLTGTNATLRWHRLRPCWVWRLTLRPGEITRRCRRFRYYLCAIPTTTPGVEIGRRHFPLNVPSRTDRRAVKMCSCRSITSSGAENGRARLADAGGVPLGRPGITLPSNSTGGVKSVALATGRMRTFAVSSKFLLVRWKGLRAAGSYCRERLCNGCCGIADTYGIMLGEKPAVLSAIVKYHVPTAGSSRLLMRWISLVAKDYARAEQLPGPCLPGGTDCHTVEGANILTRSMMIFGQGAIVAIRTCWKRWKRRRTVTSTLR